MNEEDNAAAPDIEQLASQLTFEEMQLFYDGIRNNPDAPKEAVEIVRPLYSAAWLKEKVDASPTPYERPDAVAPVGYAMPGMTFAMPPSPEVAGTEPNPEAPTDQHKLEVAAANGVDLDTGMDPEIRGIANLLGGVLGEDHKDIYKDTLDALLSQRYKEEGYNLPVSPVFTEEYTGKLAYMRPVEGGKWRRTLVNPVGMDAADVLSGLDAVVSGVVEGAGAVAGAAVGSYIPGGTTVGGAAGAGAVNYVMNQARKATAMALGVPKEVAERIDNDDMLLSAASTAGGELLGPLAVGIYRKSANTFNRPLTADDDLDEVGRQARNEAFKSARGVYEKLKEFEDRTGQKLVTDLRMLTSDPTLIALAERAESTATNKASERVRTRTLQNEAAVRNALTLIGNRSVSVGAPPMDEVSRDTVRGLMRSDLDEVELEERLAQQGIAAGLERVATRIDDPLFARTGAAIESHMQQLSEREDEAWEVFRTLTGYNRATSQSVIRMANPEGSPIRNVLAHIAQQGTQLPSASLERIKMSLVNDLGYTEQTAERAMSPFTQQVARGADPAAGNMPPAAAALRQRVAAQQAQRAAEEAPGSRMMEDTLDVNALHAVASHLKRTLKRMEESATADGWQKNDVQQIIGAIEGQLANRQFVGETLPDGTRRVVGEEEADSIWAAWQGAKTATWDKIDLVETAAVKKLMARADQRDRRDEGGPRRFQTKDSPEIRKTLLKADNPEAIRHLLPALRSDPTIVPGLLGTLETMYREKVYKNGFPTQTGHDKFMNQYSQHIRLLLGDSEATDFMRNSASMAGVLQRLQGRREQAERAFKETWGSRFEPGAKDEAVFPAMLMASTPPSSIRALRERLTADSMGDYGKNLWESLKKEGMQHLSAELRKDEIGTPNYKVIEKVLNNHGERLSEMYGAGYVADMRMMKDVLETVAQGQQGKLGVHYTPNPVVVQVFRAAFGPLSPIQRKITAATKIQQSLLQRRMVEAFLDPSELRKYVKFSKMTPGTIGFIQAGEALGLNMMELADQQAAADPTNEDAARFAEATRAYNDLEAKRRAGLTGAVKPIADSTRQLYNLNRGGR